jgi:hypothetical protein
LNATEPKKAIKWTLPFLAVLSLYALLRDYMIGGGTGGYLPFEAVLSVDYTSYRYYLAFLECLEVQRE